MQANPGGEIAASDVIGRDDLISSLWDVLEVQSLVLTSERRIGKTSILKKMRAKARPGKLLVFHDLEKVHTPLEFAELVFADVEAFLSTKKRATTRTRKFLSGLKGVEIKNLVKFPEVAAPFWKDLLTSIIADLMEEQEAMLIFQWDEIPMMLDNIKKGSGENVAMEILNTLRALRQTYPRLRMIYTGSIGLHHVLTALRESGYSNAPINDMYVEEVPPLTPEDGTELARRLLRGTKVEANDAGAVAETIASGVDFVPFYVHHVVRQLKGAKGAKDVEAVEAIISWGLTDPQDRWQLRHYIDRLSSYYSAETVPQALAVLDILAFADSPMPFVEVFNRLKSQIITADKERTRALLLLLQRDHYLIQETDGNYRFYFPLIQRYWRLQRGDA